MIRVKQIQINFLSSPLGLESVRQISWKLESDRKNVEQAAYQVQISLCPQFCETVYDTDWVEDSDSANRTLPGFMPESSRTYYVRVRVRCACGCESDWSESAKFVTGFTRGEWKPCFITAEAEESGASAAGTYLRHEFSVKGSVKEAYLYATGLGIYDAFLNGEKVGDEYLKPGFISYTQRNLYQTWDVTDRISQGMNAIGAHVGAGWYKGYIGYKHTRNIFGDRTAFACRLVLRYEDGTVETVDSDENWHGSFSPVLSSEIYDGEVYDAALEQDGWNEAGFEENDKWHCVWNLPYDGQIEPQEGARVKKFEAVSVKEIFTTPKGETILDFGQNLSGTVTIRVDGAAGDFVSLRFFEVLDAQGNAYFTNLRGIKEALVYHLKGGKAEYTPSFTFYGFRYALVENWPGTLTKEAITAYDLVSEMDPTGSFACSNEMLNQLHHNVYWGMRSNFIDVPTDCPQRDERLGWTGDAQIFGQTACYLMNTAAFFTKWMRDLALEQMPNGGIPFVVPNVLEGHISGSAWKENQKASIGTAWSDAAVILPWDLYQTYGDKEIIRNQYESMKAWMSFLISHPDTEHWNEGNQFGDWVALDAEEGSYFGATPVRLISTAYLAYTAEMMKKMALAIGQDGDAGYYGALAERTRRQFTETYFYENGEMTAQTQTAHVLALHFDLIPRELRPKTARRLQELIAKRGGHLDTGFVGTPYICFALSEAGLVEDAYDLLLKEDFPSWLYQVKMGATTIWEHWDGMKPDGTMWSPHMNSFNHYAYGAVAEWMYRVCAGINTCEKKPGFRHSVIAPKLGGNLSEVNASLQTVYGLLSSHWKVEGREVTLTVTVPCNTRATVVPDRCEKLLDADGLEIGEKDGKTVLQAGSGTYTIRYQMA